MPDSAQQPTGRQKLLEALARAICCPEGCEVVGCRGRLYDREAAAALAAIEAAGCVVVPNVATDAMCDTAATADPDAWEDDPIACQGERRELRGIFGLMLAASPYAKEPANV
jgi:hypothetical protein